MRRLGPAVSHGAAWFGLVLLALALVVGRADAATPAIDVTLGASVVPLTGPWRLAFGDDPAWASPTLDDSAWESADLTPLPGAHDADVGLSGYVPGWRANGHAGITGFAWYRLRLTVHAPHDAALAIAGPTAVDSTYQLYANGRRLGQTGMFRGPVPVVHSVQPRLFRLPPGLVGPDGVLVLALRVYMDPSEAGAPDAGGVHVAPALGTLAGITALNRVQWQTTVLGYAVDAVEPACFLLLAVMVLALMAAEPAHTGHRWLLAALVLMALVRGNQVLFFWTQEESLRGYDIARNVVLTPLTLAAWLMALRAALGTAMRRWVPAAVAALTATSMLTQWLSRSWMWAPSAHAARASLHAGSGWLRLALLVLFAWVLFASMRRRPLPLAWLLAGTLAGIGLFAEELSLLHLRGIWFVSGIGVSRTQFAYAGLIVVLFALVLHRFTSAERAGLPPPRDFVAAPGRRRQAGDPPGPPHTRADRT